MIIFIKIQVFFFFKGYNLNLKNVTLVSQGAENKSLCELWVPKQCVLI